MFAAAGICGGKLKGEARRDLMRDDISAAPISL